MTTMNKDQQKTWDALSQPKRSCQICAIKPSDNHGVIHICKYVLDCSSPHRNGSPSFPGKDRYRWNGKYNE